MANYDSGEYGTVYDWTYEKIPFDQGQFGTIHRGHEINDESKKVAVKIINRSSAQEAGSLQLLGSYKNENIVKLITFKAIDDEEKLILILEYCNGGNLLDYINKKRGKRLKSRVLLDHVIPQFQCGYQLIYQQNILHRDIKVG